MEERNVLMTHTWPELRIFCRDRQMELVEVDLRWGIAIKLNNLAQVLQDTNRLSEAEPLMRRALKIHETSLGMDHSYYATDLNNLARLLQATFRFEEAEVLLRRVLEIFLDFSRTTGYPHPHLQKAITNYTSLLKAMGYTTEEILLQIQKLHRNF